MVVSRTAVKQHMEAIAAEIEFLSRAEVLREMYKLVTDLEQTELETLYYSFKLADQSEFEVYKSGQHVDIDLTDADGTNTVYTSMKKSEAELLRKYLTIIIGQVHDG